MSDPAEHGAHVAVLPADLGGVRTVLAADRTLMAWIRTSLSMLSFGFTIYKFIQEVEHANKVAISSSPRHVGMFLVGMGVMAMLLGTFSYWTTLNDVRRTEEFRLGRPVLLMALLMSIAGVAMFAGIAWHVL
jgi:putative membrane protein